MTKTAYDFGKCHVCGEKIQEKIIKQDLWLKDKLIVINEVPAGVCPQCGEKVVTSAVGLKITALVKDSKKMRTARRMSVPVMCLNKEIA